MGDFNQYVAQVGRPYVWAQWLGGLQFLDHCCSEDDVSAATYLVRAKTSVSATYMQQTIKRLRQRLKSRLGLLQQLASLGL